MFGKIVLKFIMFINIFTILKCDVAENWQLSLQDSASPGAEGMLVFHNYLLLFLITVGICVIWFLFLTILIFTKTKHTRAVAFTHSSTLEILWTILPAVILLMISIPSFSLLYSLDEIIDPEYTVKIIGHQWYWSYEFVLVTPPPADSSNRTKQEIRDMIALINVDTSTTPAKWMVNFRDNVIINPSAHEIENINLVIEWLKGNEVSEEETLDTVKKTREVMLSDLNAALLVAPDQIKVDLKDIFYDSYMIKTNELAKGDLRLLEVDNTLPLPINTHIRLLITSSDVLHSWAVPSLGIKVDACPGRLSEASVFIKRSGILYGQCSEICGINHGLMPIKVNCCLPTKISSFIP